MIMRHFVHQLVENRLKLHPQVELLLGEGRGKQEEGGKVEGIPVEGGLLSHAYSMHEKIILGLFDEFIQFFLFQRKFDAGLHRNTKTGAGLNIWGLSQYTTVRFDVD